MKNLLSKGGGFTLKEIKNRPYDFDIDYEIETYKHIGKKVKKSHRNRKLYSICNTYSEWEKHVKNTLHIEILNYGDFIHWLNEKLRQAETFVEIIKCVLIPIYIALISVLDSFFPNIDQQMSLQMSLRMSLRMYQNGKVFVSLAIIAVVVFFSVSILNNEMQKVSFWKDYIKIAKSCGDSENNRSRYMQKLYE